MNAVSGTGQPPGGTVSPGHASRRTFLKGAGLAGAAGLAGPLLASTSARASITGIILGCNAGIYSDFTAAVPGAVGCRSYRDSVITDPSQVPATFPGQPGSKVVASIRPHPDVLLGGNTLDDAIKAMIANGAEHFSAPQLTVWHEAGNLYRHRSYITPAAVRQMHVKMQHLCKEAAGSHVGYGCIIYGDISTMDKWIPTSRYPLDWYGIDVYWNDQFDFSTYEKLKAYLDDYLKLARGRTGLKFPKIDVCETNTHRESNRPKFFKNVAKWLHNNGGRRMLTFYKAGGPSGGAWDPKDTNTINALKYIEANYG
jgi:hypothetical protein